MRKIGLRLKIDVSKIEKERLFKGKKGTYLDATVFVNLDELDQYGQNGAITQDLKQGEKANAIFIGSVKKFWEQGFDSQQETPPASTQQKQQDGYQDDIPF